MPLLGKYLMQSHIGRDAYIITNKSIKSKFGKALSKILKKSGFSVRFKLVPDTEKSKSFAIASEIISDLAVFDIKRQVFIIALGGGVIGDLAGFVASVYRRGVNYIQIPTTLLAQVDSSIGGKTAVDLFEGKNLVGTFYQPQLTLIDVSFLKTLSLRQLRSGMAEIIKYGIIKDKGLFSYLEKNYRDILLLKARSLEFVVGRCAEIKAKIVRQDEKEEKDKRTVLNFGHTIGHAIESAGGYKSYNHGEAVGLGVLVALEISRILKLISDTTFLKVSRLIQKVGLPAKIKGLPLNKIINAHYHDKKFEGKQNKFVLLLNIGRTKIVKNISLKVIRQAIKRRF